ncbi:divalent-cation tolerance protein CutA [Methanonatronarchaeum sp. AMET-Sl]|uniref:divalent-cation tolerance protein CutA n=1 Tax=Methanonatronarchaeum sp. AMET-Sl TaxID=3037654 RepID=UPI00244E0DF9|nr:divalent-cation tolerance protein CutA [Methanonatronarchaeum sp. AMET-Sl]WGI17564.1 divalent-cation tolerance protein CutA [Methanonatronarchaeum sp. AMET-Sl]
MVEVGYIVAGTREEAGEIAETLVRERLVACANIIGEVESFYWWEGEVNNDDEVVLIVKTTSKAVEETKNRVMELHSYENPAILFFNVRQTTEQYKNWIEKEVEQ